MNAKTTMNLDSYESHKVLAATSRGAQPKWCIGDSWYKVDMKGMESIAEWIATRLLEKSNIKDFCRYEVQQVRYQNHIVRCSVSEDFLKSPHKRVVSVAKLLRAVAPDLLFIRNNLLKDEIIDLTYNVEEYTGLTAFGKYLTKLFEFDAFILNEDRHLSNIAVVLNQNVYEYCPFFDNGDGLLSVLSDLECNESYEYLTSLAISQPFQVPFNDLLKVCRSLYGNQLKFYFNEEYIDEICDEAEKWSFVYANRVRGLLKFQMARYPEMFYDLDNRYSDTEIFLRKKQAE